MCKTDRKHFLAEIEAVKKTIKHMEAPVEWKALPELGPNFVANLDKYNG